TTSATRDSARFPVSAILGAGAMVHTHPTSSTDIPPTEADATVTIYGVPNYVAHGKRSVVVEVSGGQARVRVIFGDFTSNEESEILKNLMRFQTYGADD